MNYDTQFMEFVYGGIVGVAQTLVGHPFDTLKTRRQADPSSKLHFRSLFRGVSFPMASTVLITSNNFGLASYVYQETGSWWWGGLAAGGVSALFMGPLELRKVKHQVGFPRELMGSVPLYRGLGLTILRESPAHAVYFGVYHWLKDKGVHAFWGGAAAGLSSWTATYPFDVVKSRIQADPAMTLSKAWAQGQLWRGFSLAATRAVLVNGLVFWLYDVLHGLKEE